MEERYDLDLGIEHLDLESTLGLIHLAATWQARARMRQRWIDRKDPELSQSARGLLRTGSDAEDEYQP